MKVIIAGSRDFDDYKELVLVCNLARFHISEVVSGCARGADTLGEKYAEDRDIPVKKFPADWNTYKKAAGPIRNYQMGDYADALIAIRIDGSKGTTHMINYMKKLGKPVFVYDISTEFKVASVEVFHGKSA